MKINRKVAIVGLALIMFAIAVMLTNFFWKKPNPLEGEDIGYTCVNGTACLNTIVRCDGDLCDLYCAEGSYGDPCTEDTFRNLPGLIS